MTGESGLAGYSYVILPILTLGFSLTLSTCVSFCHFDKMISEANAAVSKETCLNNSLGKPIT